MSLCSTEDVRCGVRLALVSELAGAEAFGACGWLVCVQCVPVLILHFSVYLRMISSPESACGASFDRQHAFDPDLTL